MNNGPYQLSTEQIWRELSDRLRQFVRSRVNSASDVDDILQTVFLRIHQKLHELQQVGRLESWVFQIARNAIIDHFRRRRPVPVEESELVAATTEADGQNSNPEIAGCISVLVEQLPEDQKRAVWMNEFDGISQKEIARRESISLSGAKSRIQRGRRQLEKLLRDCCRFELDRRGNILAYQPLADGRCGTAGGEKNCSPDNKCS